MADNTIKTRTSLSDGVASVKMLINHPMETGQRKDKSGEKIPEHFIQELTCEHAGSTVLKALWSTGVSKNPYLSFKFSGAKSGDKLKISWVDNKGDSDSTETTIG